jgi:3-methyladenine DNA glycosylase AlkD
VFVRESERAVKKKALKRPARAARKPATMTKADVLAWLEKNGSAKVVQGMSRYGITAKRAFGIPVGTMRALAKRIGKDQALSEALWDSDWYEARMMAAFVGDPARVTAKQMDAWARDFDSWAICDTACFALFGHTRHAWARAKAWARSPREFVKRGSFALMATLVLRDKAAPDAKFAALFPLIEEGARDERNFVKKSVNWALRTIGKRNAAMNAEACRVAARLAASSEPAPRWVGKDALRELESPKVGARLGRTKVKG